MVIANFTDYNTAKATGLWQWDYGQVLRIQGLNLRTAVEIHFSLQETGGESTTRVGTTKDGVTDVVIPDFLLEKETASSYPAFAFIYLTDETSGQTEYKIRMDIKARPKPEAFDSPEDAELFREAIKAVNEAADRAEAAVSETNIAEIIQEWLNNNDIGSIDAEELAKAVSDYLTKNPIKETDPTVPAWAKQKEKPGYTAKEVGAHPDDWMPSAQDVGALPANTKIPGKTSELTNDSNFQTGEQVQSAVNEAINSKSHFRFEKVTELPEVGENNVIYLVPVAESKNDKYNEYLFVDGVFEIIGNTDIDLSGYVLKTELPTTLPNPKKLTINIGESQFIYDGSGAVVVTIPTANGGSATERIEKGSTDTEVELQPNKLYIFPEMASLGYALAPGDDGVANEYHFIFQSGATPTEVVHFYTVNTGTLTVEANKIYEISIMENMLTWQSWEVQGA